MKHFFSKKKSLILLFFLFLPFRAFAIWPFDSIVTDIFQALLSVVLKIMTAITFIFVKVAEKIMAIGLKLMTLSVDEFVMNMKHWVEIGGGPDKANPLIINPPVIEQAWGVVSNIANMVFIFAILFIAIATIIKLNYKQYLITVVIAAILVNFSLVATKVLVDLSNVASISFYDSAEKVAVAKGSSNINDYISDSLNVGGKALSLTSSSGSGDATDQALEASFNGLVNAVVSIFFYLIAAYVFYSVTFLIITRFIIIVFLMILSPLAFASYPLPHMRSRVFSRWWNALRNQLLIAPVFFFFFYVVMMLVGEFGASVFNASAGTEADLFSYMIMIGFLIFSLQAAKELSSDSTSTQIQGILRKGVGATVGAGIGVSAAAGRKWGGKVGTALQNSGTGAGLARSNNKYVRRVGQMTMGSVDKMASGSWDARNISGAGTVTSKLGIESTFNKKEASYKKSLEKAGEKDITTLKALEGQEKKYGGLKKKETKHAEEKAKYEKELNTLKEEKKKSGEKVSDEEKNDIKKKYKGKMEGLNSYEKEQMDSAKKFEGSVKKTTEDWQNLSIKKGRAFIRSDMPREGLAQAAKEGEKMQKTQRREAEKEYNEELREKTYTKAKEEAKKIETLSKKIDTELKADPAADVSKHASDIKDSVKNLTSKQIQYVPEEILIKPEVSVHLDAGHLTEASRNLTSEGKQRIRANIQNTANGVINAGAPGQAAYIPTKEHQAAAKKSADWLGGPKGSEMY